MSNDILDFEIIDEARDIMGARYFESISRFIEQGGEKLAVIRREIDRNGDRALVAFHAHSLKSSAACLGARAFLPVAQSLEMAVRALPADSPLSAISSHCVALQQAFDTLHTALLAIPSDNP
jgi:HPt (histidine-containing phosphotransfer) domain-containing protein